MTFEFRTLYAVPRFQLVLDTDRDKSTGCEGFDAFYLGDAGELYEVSTPACDQDSWISYSAGRYTTHDPDGTHVSFVVPGDVGRESHWYFIVANEDGSILDYSRIGYVTANEFIECSSVPSSATGSSSGYWLAGLDGGLWAFGSAPDIGHSCRSGNGVDVLVDLEAYPAVGDRPPTWVALHADGSITTGAVNQSVATPPAPWEVGAWRAVALIPHTGPAAADELGFWVVYDNGAVVPIGDNVPEVGDLRRMVLNQPIIDAVGDPDGTGYWLVGLDGGVFTFSGSFHGSMGGIPLNEPVVAMVADPDGTGYWLVASDGGVFAFDAPFVGSIPGVLQPGQRLNQPIVGMIPYGNGYLMLASDGGVFSFSDKPFVGSLGANPPAIPIVGVAASPAVV
ncbi:MAG: hypothetical protein GY701_32910 [Sulfitobacter sp.]|nr:hypothetical protein [Sulfitobacter sp.]